MTIYLFKQQCFKLAVGGIGGNRYGNTVETADEAVDVAVNDRMRQPEGKRGDGGSGVASHTLEFQYTLIVGWEHSSTFIHYILRGRVQIARARVVAQTLPQPQHLLLARGSQVGHRGKCLNKAVVVVASLLDASLLKDNFR